MIKSLKRVMAVLLTVLTVMSTSSLFTSSQTVDQRMPSKMIVSADQIFAPDGFTNLGKIGGNSANGSNIGTINHQTIIAFGWFASSVRIVKFGYRYGDNTVLNSAPYATEAAVISAGAEYAGVTGSTSRFKITIPVKSDQSEVWAVAQLANGLVVDMWRIIYDYESGVAADYLYKQGASLGTGWWFVPITGNEYIDITFKTSKAFNGFDTYIFGSNDSLITVFDENNNILETVTHHQNIDGTATIFFKNSYRPGRYRFRFTATCSSNYFVLASAQQPDSGAVATVKYGGGTLTNEYTQSAPYIKLREYQPAKVVSKAFNTVLFNNTVLCDTGDAALWLNSHPISFDISERTMIGLRGWTLLSNSIAGFAYRIDGGILQYGNFIQPRPDVKAAIGPLAEGYCVTADVSGFEPGTHTLEVIALSENNDKFSIAKADFTVTYDPNAPSVYRQSSFNTIKLGNATVICDTGDATQWAQINPISFESDYYGSMTFRGWAYLSRLINSFAYSIDGGKLVTGDFNEIRRDAQSVISPAALGFDIQADISDLDPGNHIIRLYAIADDSNVFEIGNVPFTVTPSVIRARDAMPDTWVATDDLGRTLPTNAETGDPRTGKYVGLFYWTWHYHHSVGNDPLNLNDFYYNHLNSNGIFDNNSLNEIEDYKACHWDEPIYGYYTCLDKWVVRRQAELLADSGVDVIFFDNSNGTFTWQESYTVVCDVFEEARAQGVNTPKIAFLLPFYMPSIPQLDETRTQLRAIYSDIYKQNKYEDLWFYFEGKPLIVAYKDALDLSDSLDAEIADFFNFRTGEPTYNSARSIYDKRWTWLSNYPQAVTYNEDGTPEQIAVGVAQNWSNLTNRLTAMNGEQIRGRTYTSHGYDTRPDAELYGANFNEQFSYALDVDPDFIFITGWNEWVASKLPNWEGTDNAFADEFNDVFSRDIEPTTGKLKDNYYYQMVSFIRQYKGTRAVPAPSREKTINMNSIGTQWDDVLPVYNSYEGNTGDRNCAGYGSTYYIDESGRNDIVAAKVARDRTNIYFMCECANEITQYVPNSAWMRLYIDVEGVTEPSWNTFEYIVERYSDGYHLLKCNRNGHSTWTDLGVVASKVSGKCVQIAVPRSIIGIIGSTFTVNFKWSDNTCINSDIMEFYTKGDVAPGGRFKYQYKVG